MSEGERERDSTGAGMRKQLFFSHVTQTQKQESHDFREREAEV